MARLKDRNTGDLLIIMFAGTICLTVLGSGLALLIVRLVQPERDLSGSLAAFVSVINTLLGLTAGFVAGRTERQRGADE